MRLFRSQFIVTTKTYVDQMTETPVGHAAALTREHVIATILIWRARLDVLALERDPEITTRHLDEIARALDNQRPVQASIMS